jgi:hypothetical protein
LDLNTAGAGCTHYFRYQAWLRQDAVAILIFARASSCQNPLTSCASNRPSASITMKTRERFYPTAIMPGWLKIVSHLNPLTYVVDALRTFMLAGSTSSFGLSRDYAVILVTTAILVFIGARLYPRLAS